MTKLTLTPLPPSVNHMYGRTRTGKTYKTKEAKDIQEAYGWLTKQQTRDFYLTPISLELIAYFADNRKHDIDNILKATQDSLTGVLWEDDSQIIDLHVMKRWDKENPRLELIIREIR